MKAAIRERYCSPQNLKIETIEKPGPKENELLIKVLFTTVNRTDCAVLTGQPFVMRFVVGLFKPKAPTPGTDFSGIVEATGSKVTSFEVNDRVFGFNDVGLASHAEYMTISENEAISVIPEAIGFSEAAASLEGMHYAINCLNKIDLKAGQKALVNGATGAIGNACLQLLKYKGLHVTAVCNTKNIMLIQSLGADKIYDYTKDDFTKDKEKYDFVFDTVGKSTFGKCKPILKSNGVYISSELGPWLQNIIYPLTTKFFGSKKVRFPIPSDIKSSISTVSGLLRSGDIKPVIDRTYPFEKINEAYQYVQSGQKTGNVVIDIGKNSL